MRKVVSATMYISDAKGNVCGKKYTPKSIPNVGYTCEIPLNLTAKGDYYIVAEITGMDGKVDLHKE